MKTKAVYEIWTCEADKKKTYGEMIQQINGGRNLFYMGETFQKKNIGITLLQQGLSTLSMYIRRENDSMVIQILQQQYELISQEIQQKKDTLETLKAKEVNKILENLFQFDETSLDLERSLMKDSMISVYNQNPNIPWKDVIANSQVKQSLNESVILPAKFPELFQGARNRTKAILLYGPPGTGKTYIANACAYGTEATVVSIQSTDILNASEKLIKQQFSVAQSSRSPCILVLDGLEAVSLNEGNPSVVQCSRLARNLLLNCITTNSQNVQILAISNQPWKIDQIVLKEFSDKVFMSGLAQEEVRLLLIQAFKDTPHKITDQEFEELASILQSFSIQDIFGLLRCVGLSLIGKLQQAKHFKVSDGKYMPVDETTTGSNVQAVNYLSLNSNQLILPPITRDDIDVQIASLKPSINPEELTRFESWKRTSIRTI